MRSRDRSDGAGAGGAPFLNQSDLSCPTVNGASKSVAYGQYSTPSSIASGIAAAFSGDACAPVWAKASGATITFTPRSGGSTNYNIASSAASTQMPLASFAAVTGGTTIYDSGTATITVNGQSDSVNWGEGATASSIAASLAVAINGDSAASVTARVNGATITLTANSPGALTDYSISVASSFDSRDFSQSSFALSVSGASLAGGQGSSSGQQMVVTYFHTDHLGSTRLMTNSSGGPVYQATFTPFGQLVNESGSVVPRYKFTGQERDTESGLDFFQARYYSSGFGRFMMPDPAGLATAHPMNPQSWNRYTYVTNNPVSRIDPTGMAGCDSDEYICAATPSIGQAFVDFFEGIGDLWGLVGSSTPAPPPSQPGANSSGYGMDSSSEQPSWTFYSTAWAPIDRPVLAFYSGTPNNGTPRTPGYCTGQALKKNGVALALDAASLGVDAFGPEAQYAKLGIGLGLSTASMINSAVNKDMTGAGLGMGSYLKAPTELAATSAGWGWAKWVPFAGAAMDVASAYHDGSQAYSDYSSCMAGH